MDTIYVRDQFIGGGITAYNNREITVDNIIKGGEAIPAGVTGTAGAAGAVTLLAGHGLTAGDEVCVSGAFGVNYNADVDAAGATGLTLSAGVGDAIPTSGAVIISKQVEIDIAFAGTQMAALSMGGSIPLEMTLETSGAVSLAKETVANGAYRWDSGNGESNPVTGDDIVKAHVYNLGIVAGTCTILVGYDND